MCGIAGTVGRVDDVAVERTRHMLDAMVHRGPDQEGLWRTEGDEGAVLGHRRLSILDLSEAGRQPMVDPDTGVVIAFNGEVYNFAELRAELGPRRFQSTSDTEVVLAAYARWGEAAIDRLRGMFAIAVWDPRDASLLLARDRLGIKPIYVAAAGGRFWFASELRALLASGAVERKLDDRALGSFLWHGFVPGPRTLVEGVRLMPAGSTLRVQSDGTPAAPRHFWELPRPSSHHDHTTEADAVARARDELERAVRMRLVSDVPLGIFLSGGVDSSVVAAMAQRSSSTPVTTFNIRFDEARYDESPFARDVARRLGTDHREVTLTEQSFAEHLDDALASIDQPTFDAINTYFVSRAVREAGITVALSGAGGDELFGGYTSFVDLPRAQHAARMLGHVPPRLRGGLARAATRARMGRGSEVHPQTRWGKLDDLLATRGDVLGLYQVSYGLFTREMLRSLRLSKADDLRWGLEPERAEELTALVKDESPLAAISLLELSSFIGERLLRDTDAASMAVSLEVRVPLLDHAFVEAMSRVPDARRFHPLRKKQLLKEMIADQLDPAVLDREKAGFELPLAVWCKSRLSPRLRETLQDINLAHAIGLDGEAVARLWRAFEKGGPGVYWSRVWSLFVLMTWCRRHGVYAR